MTGQYGAVLVFHNNKDYNVETTHICGRPAVLVFHNNKDYNNSLPTPLQSTAVLVFHNNKDYNSIAIFLFLRELY